MPIVAVLIGVALSFHVAQPAPTSDGALCSAAASRNASADTKSIVTARSSGTTAGAAFFAGCIAMGEGRADRAADHFERATQREARSLYFDWLGRAYGDQAQRANKLKQPFLAKKTKAAFERAVALDGDNLDARGYLVDYYQLAPGFMGGSESKASEQVEAIRARNAYRGGIVAATAQQRRKDPAGAEREYAALARSYPDSLGPRIALIQLPAASARWADAFRALDAARAALPDSRVLDYQGGRLAALSGQQLERGEAALRRYLTRAPAANEPTLAAAHMRLGQILQRAGKTADARVELQEAVKLDPSLDEAKKSLAALRP